MNLVESSISEMACVNSQPISYIIVSFEHDETAKYLSKKEMLMKGAEMHRCKALLW